jgi:hypothetical protein
MLSEVPWARRRAAACHEDAQGRGCRSQCTPVLVLSAAIALRHRIHGLHCLHFQLWHIHLAPTRALEVGLTVRMFGPGSSIHLAASTEVHVSEHG